MWCTFRNALYSVNGSSFLLEKLLQNAVACSSRFEGADRGSRFRFRSMRGSGLLSQHDLGNFRFLTFVSPRVGRKCGDWVINAVMRCWQLTLQIFILSFDCIGG